MFCDIMWLCENVLMGLMVFKIMIKFSVNLTEYDLKQFIKYIMKKESVKFMVAPITYFVAAVFMVVFNLFLNVGVVVWMAAAILISMSFIIFYKAITAFRKMFVQSLDLVGKNREVFVDERSLEILCDSNSLFCGRYFFYDLKAYEQNSSYFFLVFNKKIYIIVPKKSLSADQETYLKSVLDKAVET